MVMFNPCRPCCKVRVGYNPGYAPYSGSTPSAEAASTNTQYMTNGPFSNANGYSDISGDAFIPLTADDLNTCDVFVYFVGNDGIIGPSTPTNMRKYSWWYNIVTGGLSGPNLCQISTPDLYNWILSGGRCLVVTDFAEFSFTNNQAKLDKVSNFISAEFQYFVSSIGSTLVNWQYPTSGYYQDYILWTFPGIIPNNYPSTYTCGWIEALPTSSPVANGCGNMYDSSRGYGAINSFSGPYFLPCFFQGGNAVTTMQLQFTQSNFNPALRQSYLAYVSKMAVEAIGNGYVGAMDLFTFNQFITGPAKGAGCNEIFKYLKNFRDLPSLV